MQEQHSGIPAPSRSARPSYKPRVQSKLRHEIPPSDLTSGRNGAVALKISTNSALPKLRTKNQVQTSSAIPSGKQSSFTVGERRRSIQRPKRPSATMGNLLKHTLKAKANKENDSLPEFKSRKPEASLNPDHPFRPKLPKPLHSDSTLLRRARTYREYANGSANEYGISGDTVGIPSEPVVTPKSSAPLLIRKRRNGSRTSICSSDIFAESGSCQTLPSQILVHTPLAKAHNEGLGSELTYTPSYSSSLDLKIDIQGNDIPGVRVKSTWTMMDEMQLIRNGGLISQAHFALVPHADLHSIPLYRKRYTGIRWSFSLGSHFSPSSSLATLASKVSSSHMKVPGVNASIRSFSVPVLALTPRQPVPNSVHSNRPTGPVLGTSPSSRTCEEVSDVITIGRETDEEPPVETTPGPTLSTSFDSARSTVGHDHTSTISRIVPPGGSSLNTNSSFFFLASASRLSNSGSPSLPVLSSACTSQVNSLRTRSVEAESLSSPLASSIEIVNHPAADIPLLDSCQIPLTPSRKIFELPLVENSGNTHRGTGLNAGMSYAKQVVKLVRSKTASFKFFASSGVNSRRN